MCFLVISRQNHPGFKNGPKSNDLVVFLYEEERTHETKSLWTQRERLVWCGNKSMNTEESLEKVGRDKGFSHRNFRGSVPSWHLDFRHLASRTERRSFCCIQVPRVCMSLLPLAQPFASSYQGHQGHLAGYEARDALGPLDIRTGCGAVHARPLTQCDVPQHAYLCAHLEVPAENAGHNQLPQLVLSPWSYMSSTRKWTLQAAIFKALPGTRQEAPRTPHLVLGDSPVSRLNACPFNPCFIPVQAMKHSMAHTVWSEILQFTRSISRYEKNNCLTFPLNPKMEVPIEVLEIVANSLTFLPPNGRVYVPFPWTCVGF